MRRWHLTLGLAVIALGGAWLAPRLTATPPSPPAEPTAPAPVEIPEVDATQDGILTLSVGLSQTALRPGESVERFLVVEIGAPEAAGEYTRRPLDVSIVMDASGSMGARGKMDYARQAARTLAASLEPGDTLSVVTFNDRASVVVPPQAVEGRLGRVEATLDQIYEGGGTNLFDGLDQGLRALEQAQRHRDERIGRLVLLSDGNANMGITDPAELSRLVSEGSTRGMTVSTVGLGVDYNEDLLSLLGDRGGGTYDFVGDPRELTAVFSDELQRAASVVARQANLRLTLPQGVEPLEIIGWDATAHSDGWTVWLGDVYSATTRKIVARVRVRADALGSLQVADATLSYADVLGGEQALEIAEARALVTEDAGKLAAAVDKDRAAKAKQAEGTRYLDLSSRAYQQGDVRRARELAARGAGVLSSAAVDFDSPDLLDDASELEAAAEDYSAYQPSSTAGLEAIKRHKEVSRALTR